MHAVIKRSARSVIGIRCQKVGLSELRLRSLLLNYFSENEIYFIIDRKAASLEANFSSQKTLVVDVRRLGLEGCKDWGWRCGDFFYYAFISHVEADFYYLIEPDVWFTNKTGQHIFRCMNDVAADFAAYNLGVADLGWYWRQSMLGGSDLVYKCAFPFTRLSHRAVSHLLNRRAAMDKLKSGSNYPNDESFVATTICSNATLDYFSLENIPDLNWKYFSTVRTRPREFCNKDNFIYHSALDFDEFSKKINRFIEKAGAADLSKLNSIFDFAFFNSGPNEEFIEKFTLTLGKPFDEIFSRWVKSRAIA